LAQHCRLAAEESLPAAVCDRIRLGQEQVEVAGYNLQEEVAAAPPVEEVAEHHYYIRQKVEVLLGLFGPGHSSQ
jgi:hypothetical protein